MQRIKRDIRCVWNGTLSGLILKNASFTQPTRKIIGLHGWLDNLNSMLPLAEELLRRNSDYEIFLYDMAGNGFSSHLPRGYGYSSVGMMRDLREIVLSLGWTKENYALIGHSYGGIIAMGYAASYSDELSCIVTIDALPTPEVSSDAFWSVYGERIDKTIEFFSTSPKQREQELTMEKAIEITKSTREGLTDTACRLLLERLVRRDSNGKLHFARDESTKTRELFPSDEHLIRSMIMSVQIPVLFIEASHSQWPRSQHTIDLLEEYNENFEMTLIDGPHHLHMTKAEQVAERIDQYFHTFLYQPLSTTRIEMSKLSGETPGLKTETFMLNSFEAGDGELC